MKISVHLLLNSCLAQREDFFGPHTLQELECNKLVENAGKLGYKIYMKQSIILQTVESKLESIEMNAVRMMFTNYQLLRKSWRNCICLV